MPPLHFNQANVNQVLESEYAPSYIELENRQSKIFEEKKALIYQYKTLEENENIKKQINKLHHEEKFLMNQSKDLIKKANPEAEVEDDDYIFITFVINYLPIGIVGLLLAVIFSAAMSSTASELNALASTTTVDIYKRNLKKDGSEKHYLQGSKLFTLLFGLFAIAFAAMASLFDNLIEAVNILGSLFYGTILGIFLVAFFFKFIKGNAVFIAAIISQLIIIFLYTLNRLEIINIGYLWYNLIAPALVIGSAFIIQYFTNGPLQKIEE